MGRRLKVLWTCNTLIVQCKYPRWFPSWLKLFALSKTHKQQIAQISFSYFTVLWVSLYCVDLKTFYFKKNYLNCRIECIQGVELYHVPTKQPKHFKFTPISGIMKSLLNSYRYYPILLLYWDLFAHLAIFKYFIKSTTFKKWLSSYPFSCF